MQGSLERLLAGTAASLRASVAPAVTDAYALAQVQAAAEVLDNLAARVAWRTDTLVAPLAEAAALLADAATCAPAGDLPTVRAWLARPERGADGAQDWVSALDAVAELQEWLAADDDRAPQLAERTRAFASSEVAREMALLRTGMYRVPPA
jgi:hypothetical protein